MIFRVVCPQIYFLKLDEHMKAKSKIKMRLLEFLDNLSLSQSAFEKSVGLSNGWCNNLGDSIREATLSKIHDAYPDLNLTWLKAGVGSMYGEEDPEPGSKKSAELLPLLPIQAQAGSLNDFNHGVLQWECEMIISPIKGADFAMSVSGESMAPEYPNGSQIFVKKINEKAFIDWGRAYLLDTVNGRVIKILTPSEHDGYIKCSSLNPDPRYAPFEVAMDDIYGIYRILLCMSVK